VNILDAAADKNLFAPWFKDRRSWSAWFAFLAAVFGLPMTEDQLATYRECTGRLDPPQSPVSEAWLVIGRRGGKSFILALLAIYLACFFQYRKYLAPGERATIPILATDRAQARTILRYVRGLLRAIPMLSGIVERETASAFDLANSITIEVHTASFRVTRGYTIVAALCDEIAFWPSEDAAQPDHEVLNALRPGMATIPGAMLLCASSPYGRRGALWDTYRRNFRKPGPVLVWQAPTRTMNPSVPQHVIDTAMEADPLSAQGEWFAEFRRDIDAFIAREAVESCVSPGVWERPPVSAARYFGFVDPSGGSTDAFALAIAHRDANRIVLDALREVRPPFSPESVVDEFAALLRSYRVSRVTGDRYAGEWPREQFRKRGISYEAAVKAKSDLYRDLLPLINSRRCELLDHPKLITQFTGLERRIARGGRDSIDHAPGAHDDVANACAGALLGALNAYTRRVLEGACGYGGPITWRDLATGEEIDPDTLEPIKQTRVRFVKIPEALAPAARGR
jgi:hypothetical protein